MEVRCSAVMSEVAETSFVKNCVSDELPRKGRSPGSQAESGHSLKEKAVAGRVGQLLRCV